ncbi:winged helix DNA-binding domain-containing protein [Kitasatospora sp. NPDC048365]|uniref:winged helix DNA-binding domain-containing protein n=1 Tax=Kitasatospora sp. NPDC048365 TaxID=3364050 RepID=UPI0037129BF1
MGMRVTHEQVFAWRLRRQGLVPRGGGGVAEVVRRLCGVQAQVASAAELAVAVRQEAPRPGAVAAALADRTVVRTWAMRGTLHLMDPGDLPSYLSLISAARTWEKPSWQRTFGVTPDRMAALGDAVEELLSAGPLSRAELTEALVARPAFADLREQLTSGWGTVLKPLAWTGRLCNGPGEGNRAGFAAPRTWIAGWLGTLPEPEQAAHTVLPAYLGAHGPATAESFDAWLLRGASRKARLRGWFAALGDRLAEVSVDGEPRRMLAEDVAELAATQPSEEVVLLPGFDQYVLGTGTSDARLLAPERRSEVSRAAGWISPVVVHGGRVAGVWEFDGDVVDVRLFAEHGALPAGALEAAAERLAACTGAPRRLAVRTV